MRVWENCKVLAVLSVELALALPAAIFAATPTASATDIAFFYALDADFAALKAAAVPSIGSPIKVGSRSIAVFNLAGQRIYAVKMGSGAVETAASAQALLGRCHCDLAISLGPVGALSDDFKPGEWHLVNSVAAYQRGAWTRQGFRPGPDDSDLKLPPLLAAGKLPALFRNERQIRVASGELFVNSDRFRVQLRDSAKADAADMNLFGLLSVCRDHAVPLANWRVVSDLADDAAADAFRGFVEKYDGEGGRAFVEIVRALPPDPNSPDTYPELKKLLEAKGAAGK